MVSNLTHARTRMHTHTHTHTHTHRLKIVHCLTCRECMEVWPAWKPLCSSWRTLCCRWVVLAPPMPGSITVSWSKLASIIVARRIEKATYKQGFLGYSGKLRFRLSSMPRVPATLYIPHKEWWFDLWRSLQSFCWQQRTLRILSGQSNLEMGEDSMADKIAK